MENRFYNTEEIRKLEFHRSIYRILKQDFFENADEFYLPIINKETSISDNMPKTSENNDLIKKYKLFAGELAGKLN